MLISFSREITVPNQRIKGMTDSVLPPASIIYHEAPPYVACINSTTTLVTVTLHTVIWSPSLVQRGPWWCLGLTRLVHCRRSALFPLPATLQWMRIHRIGICTAWAWHEWDHCKLIALTGGRLAATQPMVWISETTLNVVDYSGLGKCMKVEYVNIRGHMCMHLTARV